MGYAMKSKEVNTGSSLLDHSAGNVQTHHHSNELCRQSIAVLL